MLTVFAYLATAQSLLSAHRLHIAYLVTVYCLPSDCPVTRCLLPRHCILTAYYPLSTHRRRASAGGEAVSAACSACALAASAGQNTLYLSHLSMSHSVSLCLLLCIPYSMPASHRVSLTPCLSLRVSVPHSVHPLLHASLCVPFTPGLSISLPLTLEVRSIRVWK